MQQNNVNTKVSLKWLSSMSRAVGNQRTLLHCAVRSGDAAKVQAVLQLAGVDINAADAAGRTAMFFGCGKGSSAIVELLLKNKACVSSRDHRGITPLMAAATSGSAQVVRCLLNYGCDVNASNASGVVALLMACHRSASEVVPLLLAAGADVNHSDTDNFTSLMLACSTRSTESLLVVQQLLKAPAIKVNAANRKGATALMIASFTGSVAIVRQLLKARDIHVNAKDNSGATALMYACCGKASAAVVQQLLQAGADVFCRFTSSRSEQLSALDVACRRKDAATIKLLLAAGAPLSQFPYLSELQSLQEVIQDLALAEATPRRLNEAVISLAFATKRARPDDAA